jgi:beta-barrel assembly-enhancing protease
MRIAALFFLGAALFAQSTPSKESALGARMAADFVREHTLVHDAALSAAVERIGERLAAEMPGGYKYTFTVIAEDGLGIGTLEPNSFPGGHLFVPASLIRAARDESELAGMLAHAMAHIAERHGMRQLSQGAIPLIFMGAATGIGGANSHVPLALRPVMRQDELDADALALSVLKRAGFDASALPRYIARMQNDGAGWEQSVIPSMPSKDTRLAAIAAIL